MSSSEAMILRGMPLVAALLFMCCVGAHARYAYADEVPNGRNAVDCDNVVAFAIGHINVKSGGGPRNQFGLDYVAAGRTWTKELCEKDSDGDGVPNGKELGDPDCTWQKGDTPSTDQSITHPGLSCLVPTPAPLPDTSPLFLQHGMAMILAWALLLPTGAAAPVSLRHVLGDPLWFKVHQALQLAGALISFYGAICAMRAVYGTHFWGNAHKFLGLVVLLLTVVQVAGGLARPHKPGPDEPVPFVRTAWFWSHRIIGGTLLVYSILQCIGGIALYGEYGNSTIFLRIALAILAIISWGLLVGGRFLPTKKKEEAEDLTTEMN